MLIINVDSVTAVVILKRNAFAKHTTLFIQTRILGRRRFLRRLMAILLGLSNLFLGNYLSCLLLHLRILSICLEHLLIILATFLDILLKKLPESTSSFQ